MTDQERLWQAMVAIQPQVLPLFIDQQPALVGGQAKININLSGAADLSFAAATHLQARWKAAQAETGNPVSEKGGSAS